MGAFFVDFICFFFNDTATTEIYTLSLHDALPILMNSASREPQSWSIAPFTVRAVVSGPGVSSQGSRRDSVMAIFLSVLGLDPEMVRVVRGPEAAARGESVGRDLDREARLRQIRSVQAAGTADIAQGDGAADRMAKGGRSGGAHNAPVAPDRLVAQREGPGVLEDEADQPLGERLAALGEQGLPAYEGRQLVEADGETQPSLERRIVGRQLAPPCAVGLLDAERLDGVVASVREPQITAGRMEGIIHAGGELDRHVELPAELADVRETRSAHERAREPDLPARPEGESGVRQVGPRE